jgi:hypothetical protein
VPAKTGEVWQVACQDRFAKIDIADEPIERVGCVMIGRSGKQP